MAKAANKREAVKNIAVIYCRVSTRGQEDGSSLETQEDRSRKFCRENGLLVYSVHKDVHTGSELDRPGLNQALSEVRQGNAGVLVSYDIDRLSRNQTHLAVIIHQVQEQFGGSVQFVMGKLDDSPMGVMIRSIVAGFAEMEREKIKERMNRGKRARAEKGAILPGSFPIYGYQWTQDRKAYVIDQEVAPVVKRIFQEVANGSTLYKIAKGLDSDGIPTPSQYFASLGLYSSKRDIAKLWKTASLHNMLHNPAYIGQRDAYRWESVKVQKSDERGRMRRYNTIRLRKGDDCVPLPSSVCPAIIDESLWERAHQQLTINKKESTRNTKHPEQALLARGFIVCGYCGVSCTTVYRGSIESARYRCSRLPSFANKYKDVCEESNNMYAPVQEIDNDVWSKVEQLMQHPKYTKQAVEGWKKRSGEEQAKTQERLDAIDALIAKQKTKQSRLIRAIEDTADDVADELRARIKEINQQIQRLQQEKRMMSNATNRHGPIEQGAGVERFLRAFAQASRLLPYEDKRHILHFLGVKVRVFKGDTGIKWEVSFAWNGLNNEGEQASSHNIASTMFEP